MASGCIFGKCPVCGELVWEDDWFMDDNGKMYHQKCHALREFGSLNVAEKLNDIEESIEGLIEMNKSYQAWFNQQVQRLKDEVNFEKKK